MIGSTQGTLPRPQNEEPMRRALLIVAILLPAVPATASARVALVATGAQDVALLDVSTNHVVARVKLPGPSTAVAVAPDGATGFAAGGTALAAVDLGALPNADAAPQRPLPAPVAGLAVSPAGGRVYAAAGTILYVLDARTLKTLHRVRLNGTALGLAVSHGGSTAAVPLARGRVAMVA